MRRREGGGWPERSGKVIRVIKAISGSINVKKPIVGRVIWGHRPKWEDDFIDNDMTGNDYLFGVEVKTTKTFVI